MPRSEDILIPRSIVTGLDIASTQLRTRDKVYKQIPKFKIGTKVEFINKNYDHRMKVGTPCIVQYVFNYSETSYSIKVLEGYFKNRTLVVPETFLKKIDERKLPTWL